MFFFFQACIFKLSEDMSDSLRGKLTELIESGSEMVAFSDTFMGDEGCHVVYDMLRENKCVKSLDL